MDPQGDGAAEGLENGALSAPKSLCMKRELHSKFRGGETGECEWLSFVLLMFGGSIGGTHFNLHQNCLLETCTARHRDALDCYAVARWCQLGGCEGREDGEDDGAGALG